MSEKTDDTSDLVIKIPSSLMQKASADHKVSSNHAGGDYRSFERSGLIPIDVERNSEHGITQVKSLGFSDEQHRARVLELLDGPTLFRKLSQLYAFIRELGGDRNFEKRYFAALAVAQLLGTQPFSDLKVAIILPWANTENPWIRQSASIALAAALEDRHGPDTLALLKHWVASDNPFLADAALLTFLRQARGFPNEALDAIGKVMSTARVEHYPTVLELFEAVYDSEPSRAIKRLQSWMFPIAQTDLCWIAGVLALGFLRIGDFATSDENREAVVEITYALWDDPRFPLHQEMQEQTTLTVEHWATEVLDLWEKESVEVRETFRTFFHDLYQKCADTRRNRLDYYLRRWHERKARARSRKSRATSPVEQDAAPTASYLDLIPDQGAG